MEKGKTLTLGKVARGTGETHLKGHKFHLVGWSKMSDRDIFAATGATSRTGSMLSAWLPSYSSSLHVFQVHLCNKSLVILIGSSAPSTNVMYRPGAVAFGGLMGDKTENLIGISETLIVSSVSGNLAPLLLICVKLYFIFAG